jgi:predicted nucleotidyltransferase
MVNRGGTKIGRQGLRWRVRAPTRGYNVERDPLLAEIVRRLVVAYQPERIYLFGSRARGEVGPDSDYDVLVMVPDTAPPERRHSRLGYEALWGTGVAVDIVVVTRGYYKWMLGAAASLPATVDREGKLIYAT